MNNNAQDTRYINEYTKTNFEKICRTCLSEAEVIYKIFQLNYNEQSFPTILKLCTSITIEKNDCFPQNICVDCIGQIISMYNFVIRCQQSAATLENILKAEEKKYISENVFSITSNKNTKSDTSRLISNVCLKNTKEQSLHGSDEKEPEVLFLVNTDSKEIPEVTDKCDKTCELETRKAKIHKEKSTLPPYSCYKCNIIFQTPKELKDHLVQVKHSRPRSHVCSICSKAFLKNHNLMLHMRTHNKEKPYQCNVCQKSFSLNCNLKRHMMTHTGEKPHKCDFCGKAFIQGVNLKEHMRTHTGETSFICSYCGKTFTQSSNHRSHLLSHLKTKMQIDNITKSQKSLQEIQCNICKKLLSSKAALRTHLLIHGEKKYLCSMCGKGFYTNGALQVHFNTHTGLKPYSCNICNKSFSQSTSLKSHSLIHTGQKPFNCKVCKRAFTQLSHLTYHMRTHSGERPYACKFCGKCFALNGNLTVHIRTHTGETPYVCDVCGKGFYDSSSMKKHRRGHDDNCQKSVEEVDTDLFQTLKS